GAEGRRGGSQDPGAKLRPRTRRGALNDLEAEVRLDGRADFTDAELLQALSAQRVGVGLACGPGTKVTGVASVDVLGILGHQLGEAARLRTRPGVHVAGQRQGFLPAAGRALLAREE